MRVITENAQNDFELGPDNRIGSLTGIEAVLQVCQSTIEGQRGEMQYNTNRGIPTEETLWGGTANQHRFQFFCIEALKGVTGVSEVTRFNTQIIDSELRYRADITTIFGAASIGSLFDGV